MSDRPDPTRIVVPRNHGQILLEPGLDAACAAMGSPANKSYDSDRLGAAFSGNFAGVRKIARDQFLGAARQWAVKTDSPAPPPDATNHPWVITGHQLEFYHAGVWAKVIAADEMARRTNAIAFDLLVDHDLLDEFGFDMPAQNGAQWKRVGVHWAKAPNLPAEALAAPQTETFRHWDAELAKYPHGQSDSLAFFLSAPAPRGQSMGYPTWMSRARSAFERAMDLNVAHVPTSLMCSQESWLIFVHAWIQNARPWTTAYNAQIAAYRTRNKIKSAQHPMPDLERSSDTLELPFWIYRAGEPRQRMMVRIQNENRILMAGGEEMDVTHGLAPALAAKWQIRPRALTLTMYVRLFLADFFIHGIGGALYDQITDGLMNELFGVALPYNCVSAAWLLPIGQARSNVQTLSDLAHQRHHMVHNPQIIMDRFTAARDDVKTLLHQRAETLRTLSGRDPSSTASLARRQAFHQLHEINAALHTHAPILLQRIDNETAKLKEELEQNRVLLWREYFFGLHSMESLHRLIEKIRTSKF